MRLSDGRRSPGRRQAHAHGLTTLAADSATDATVRREALARQWRVTIDRSIETPSSLISFGRRDAQPVVLKVIKRPCDEWIPGRY